MGLIEGARMFPSGRFGRWIEWASFIDASMHRLGRYLHVCTTACVFPMTSV